MHAEQKCSRCKQFKPLSEFVKNRAQKNGLNQYCKKCTAEYRCMGSDYHKKDTVRALKKRYDITINEYNAIYEKQKGVCAICGLPESATSPTGQTIRLLSVDHCHKTGKIRGLLCAKCNHGLGAFRDDIKFLGNAIKYLLEKNEPRRKMSCL